MKRQPLGVEVSVPVVVLRSGRGAFPQHGALGVVRSLGRLGVPVFMASPTRGGIAGSSRYVQGWHAWAPHAVGDPEAVAALLRLGARHPGAVLVPTDDLAAMLVDAHARELQGAFRIARVPEGVVPGLVDKLSLVRECERLDVPFPRTAAVSTVEEVDDLLRHATLPIVVKADLEAIVAGTGKSVSVARTRQEVLGQVEAAAGRRVLLQEYIPGHPGRVNWMFDAYLDGSGRCLFGATGRKTAQYPAYSGMATSAVSERNDRVEAIALSLLRGVGYVGPVDVDLRYDARDARFKVVDVNPRIGGSFRLFVAPDGMDAIRAAYLDLTGQPVPASTVLDGRTWLVETHVAASAVAYRRDGWTTTGRWLREIVKVDEGALFGLDDPKPMVGAAGHAAARIASRIGLGRRVRG